MTPSLCLSPPSPAATESPLCRRIQGAAVPRRWATAEPKPVEGLLCKKKGRKNQFSPQNVHWG